MHLPEKPCNYAPLFSVPRSLFCVLVTLRHAYAQTPVGVCVGVVSILTTKTPRSSAVVKQEHACIQGNVFCKMVLLCIIIIIFGLHKDVATLCCPRSS